MDEWRENGSIQTRVDRTNRKIPKKLFDSVAAPRILNPLKLGSMGAGSSVAGKHTARASRTRAAVDKLGPDSVRSRRASPT